jgi:hypothetical protein
MQSSWLWPISFIGVIGAFAHAFHSAKSPFPMLVLIAAMALSGLMSAILHQRAED